MNRTLQAGCHHRFRIARTAIAIVGGALMLLFSGPGASAAEGEDVRFVKVNRVFPAEEPQMFVENEFIVVLTPEGRAQATRGAILGTAIQKSGAVTFERQFAHASPQPAGSPSPDLTGHYKVVIPAGADLDAAMAAFAADPSVDHVEKIGIHPIYACASGTGQPANDTYYRNPPPTFNFPQWDLWDTFGIDAEKAWSTETGDPTVVVVAMDTGVRYFHRDLGGNNPPGPADSSTDGNIWVNPFEIPGNGIDDDGNGRIDDVIGYDFVSGNPTGCASGAGEDCANVDNDPRDFNGHGTHTAGTMAAITNNARGVAGVAGGFGDGTTASAGNGAKLMCCRIGWSDNAGNGFVRMDFAALAMSYVADLKNRGVNIAAVNCSWGSSNSGGIDAAVNSVLAADVMIIHAAGNSNSSTADYLGNKAGVLNVAATDQSGFKASFSNFGSWVDVAAPGVDIISTWHQSSDPEPDYVAVLDGTSMAAPHVAGVAALLESCNPALSGPDKFNLIVGNVCPANSSNIGSGILNAQAALAAAGCGGGGCSTDPECDDGLFCNGAETCVAGSCQPGTAPNCNDGIVCTTDLCNEATDACDHVPNNAACDDGLFCNGAETCSATLGCQAGADPCPGQSCDEAGDFCFDPGVCDNDSACESGEDCNNCPADCFSGSGAVCGNNVCEAGNGEDCLSCPQDCNGRQSGQPSGRYCCGDGDGQNPVGCGDARCTASGNSCTSAPSGPSCCGDSVCDGAETACNCSIDCGAPPVGEVVGVTCGDGLDNDCDGLTDCADADCAGDPGCAPPSCDNDGTCESGEDCNNCPNDCSGKQNGPPSGRYCCGNGILEGAEGDGSVCDGNF